MQFIELNLRKSKILQLKCSSTLLLNQIYSLFEIINLNKSGVLVKLFFSFIIFSGQQDRGQVPGGTRPHHDLPQVQLPEVVPGGGHRALRPPRRHGCQRLLGPLRQNVSVET